MIEPIAVPRPLRAARDHCRAVRELREHSRHRKGVWWAMDTITPMGYGDRFSVTPFGQPSRSWRCWWGSGWSSASQPQFPVTSWSGSTERTGDRLVCIVSLPEQLLAPTDGTGDLAQNLTVTGAGPVAHRRGALLT
jgi:hypothetical protein